MLKKYGLLLGGSFLLCILLLYIFGAFNTTEKKKIKKRPAPPRIGLIAAVVIGNVNVSNYAIVTCRQTIFDSVYFDQYTDERTILPDTSYEILLETVLLDGLKQPVKNVAGKDSTIFQFVKYPKRMVLGQFDLPQ